MRKFSLIAILILGSQGLAQIGHAAVSTWQGTGTTTTPTTGSWGTATNWSGGAVPASGATTELDFAGTAGYTATNNTGTVPFQLNILTFGGSAGTEVLAGTQLQFVANASLNPVINQNGTATVTVSAPIDMANDLTLQGAGTGGMLFSGVVSGNSQLIINETGNANVTLSASNTYSGGTTLTKGSLITQATGALGTGTVSLASKWTINTNAQTFSNAVSLAGAATIDGQSAATLSGNIALGSSALTLRSSNATGTVRTVSGVISGAGSVTKNDNLGAYWILSGNNTYTGTTTANQGKLAVTGTTSGQGNYVVGSTSATTSATLAGNGTIGLAAGKTVTVVGSTSAASAAFLAPSDATGADATVGTLAFVWAGANAANQLTIGNGSNQGVFAVDVAGSGSSDRLVLGSTAVTATLNLGSASDTLALNSLAGAFDGSTYTILNYFGTLTGTFDTLTLNGVTQSSATSFTANGTTYNVVYGVVDPLGGYDIQLQAVPEPGTLWLLAAAGLVWIAARRRLGSDKGCPRGA
ncbi:MAG TPA: autotransporter-associated beta strand repeat-containing protein [Candidatus Methylacidiphilales bacterium]